MAKHPGGRPSKLTTEVRDDFITALKAGNYLEDAADYAGIGASTARLWMAKGRLPGAKKEYRQFLFLVEKAIASDIVRSVATISKAATEDWKAAAWKLEHRHRMKFGPGLEIINRELERVLDALKAELPPDEYENVLRVVTTTTGDPG